MNFNDELDKWINREEENFKPEYVQELEEFGFKVNFTDENEKEFNNYIKATGKKELNQIKKILKQFEFKEYAIDEIITGVYFIYVNRKEVLE